MIQAATATARQLPQAAFRFQMAITFVCGRNLDTSDAKAPATDEWLAETSIVETMRRSVPAGNAMSYGLQISSGGNPW